MTEANNNANSFNSEFKLESSNLENMNQANKTEGASATAKEVKLAHHDLPLEKSIDPGENQEQNPVISEPIQAGEHKMNWQKVAHKLREYNRKLLKKVFRLEQELADIDNKFNKCIEKSKSSDLLVAQQERELRKYQEETELFESHLAEHQATIKQKEIILNELSEQYQLAQQEAAQLERDCALLQENYNHQVYELTVKDKEIKELKDKLNQQQRSALQYKAELQRYQEQTNTTIATPAKIAKQPAIPVRQSYSPQRTIQPWSTSAVAETKISLPKTKSKPIAVKKAIPTETIKTKTPSQIASWSASQAKKTATSSVKNNSASSQSSIKAKPTSLAAVDLPTFPRQR